MAEYTRISIYGYTPSLEWTATYVAIFSALAAIKAKYWLIFPTLILGALIECMGWAARLWSSQDVLRLTPFLMQICTLIMAPVFFSAYDYTILGLAISRLGPQYSLLRPSWYFIVFLTADIVSLILQAIGGGQAASSASTSAPTQSATNIMVAGIIFQLIAMVIFMSLGVDFVIRASTRRPYAFQVRRLAREKERAAIKVGEGERPEIEHHNSTGSADTEGTRVSTPTGNSTSVPMTTKEVDAEAAGSKLVEGGMTEKQLMRRWWIFLVGVGISSLMVILRGVFRSIELSEGWDGHLATTENYQNLLDGLPMIIAVAIYIPFHPYFLLPPRTTWKGVH